MLAASIGWEAEGEELRNEKRIDSIAKVCNTRHFGAKDAQRASEELHTLLYFRGREVEEIAYVTSVKASGCALLIPRLGLEGFIASVRDAHGAEVQSIFDDDTKTLYRHRHDGEPWALRTFSRMRVKLLVDPERLRPKLDFEILEVTGGIVPEDEAPAEITEEDIQILRSLGR